MKFRRLIFFLIIAAVLAAYFTKPTKDDFLKQIQPNLSRSAMPPVVEYNDKFLFANVTVTYVSEPSGSPEGRNIASASKEEYIGAFKRFWKQD